MQEPVYHIPALLNECLEGLNISPNGTYVDVTFGGGGHSRGIVENLGEGGRLFSFDQDSDAEKNIKMYRGLGFLAGCFFVIVLL